MDDNLKPGELLSTSLGQARYLLTSHLDTESEPEKRTALEKDIAWVIACEERLSDALNPPDQKTRQEWIVRLRAIPEIYI